MLSIREGIMATKARYELTDAEWKVIAPLLPNKSRGVKRVDDRRVLNGIFWRLRSGAPWADIPERYGPHTTCYNRFVRWRKAGIWDRLLSSVSDAYDGRLQMIDSTVVRVHQHAANSEKKVDEIVAWDAPAAGLRPRSMRSSTPAASRSR
jgi:transposase